MLNIIIFLYVNTLNNNKKNYKMTCDVKKLHKMNFNLFVGIIYIYYFRYKIRIIGY